MARNNIKWHHGKVTRKDRKSLLENPNKVIWLTGLSGSGKSTIAYALQESLHDRGILCYVLDGDNVRHGLNSNLGFTQEDREENIRRVSEVMKLMYDAGLTIIVSFISPFRKDRDKAREMIGADFIEVFVECPLEVCEQRDPKGLYKKARKGEIKDFTGVSQEYEAPIDPEIIVNTAASEVKECIAKIVDKIQ